MKKLEGTPYAELKITTSNIWLDLLSSLPFIVFGLFLVFESETTTLICQRIDAKQGNCQLTESKLLGSNSQEFSLNNLLGSKVVPQKKHNSLVVVLTKTGNIALGNPTWGDKNHVANRIDSFVKNTDIKSLNVRQDDRWQWIFGIMFVLGGVFTYVDKRRKLYL